MKTLLALAVTLLLADTALASPVTFTFAGTLSNAPISGSYTFDSTVPRNDVFVQGGGGGRLTFFDTGIVFDPSPGSSPTRTSHADAITAATVNWTSMGTLDPTYPLGSRGYGSNGITAMDSTYAATFQVQGLTGYDWFGLTIDGTDVVDNGLLPTVPPSLNLSPSPSARLELFNFHTGAFIQGTLTSLTAVPLPGAVVLFGSGLLALWSWRYRSRISIQSL